MREEAGKAVFLQSLIQEGGYFRYCFFAVCKVFLCISKKEGKRCRLLGIFYLLYIPKINLFSTEAKSVF